MEGFGDIGSEVLKALALALLIPLFAPVLQFFDRSRKHAETKRKLELIKLMAEVDEVTGVCGEDRTNVLAAAVAKIAENSDEVKELLSETREQDLYPLPPELSRFSKLDALSAIVIPLAFSVFMYSDRNWASNNLQVSLSLFFITATLSLISAKYFICKKVESEKWQIFWHLFISAALLLPALFVVVLFDK